MKEDVERPTCLVDITRLPLRDITRSRAGLSIGALATNTETANHPLVRENYPLLTQASVPLLIRWQFDDEGALTNHQARAS